jgi:hypothetical protein
VGQRRVQPVDHSDRQDRIEVFGIPVLALAGRIARIERAGPGIAAQFAAGVEQRGDHACDAGETRVEQQRFHRPADAGAAHLGVERNGRAMSGSAAEWM